MNSTLRNILIVIAALALYEFFIRQMLVDIKEKESK